MMAIEEELHRLQTMTSAALHARWIEVTGSTVPRVSPKILRLALGWEIQATACGDVSRKTTRTLDQFARGTRATPVTTTRLTRVWRGHVHVVTIEEDQIIRWDEREWRSLSEVARAITGTRWSGPAFFGLRKKAAA